VADNTVNELFSIMQVKHYQTVISTGARIARGTVSLNAPIPVTRGEESGVIKIPPDIIERQRREEIARTHARARTRTRSEERKGRHGRGEKKKSRRAAKETRRANPSFSHEERERERV
jgi:hypothetical protein